MNAYELVFILKEDNETTTNKLKTYITEPGGVIKTAEKWGKKDFAYPIKKLTSGYYFIWRIDLSENKISELKKKMDYDEEIVRYLLIKSEARNSYSSDYKLIS